MKRLLMFILITGLISPYCAFAEIDKDKNDIVKRHEEMMKKRVADQRANPQKKYSISDTGKGIKTAVEAAEPFDINFAIEKARTIISLEEGVSRESIVYMYYVPYAIAHPPVDGLNISTPGDYRYFIMFKDANNSRKGWAIDYIVYNPSTKLWEKQGYGVLNWMIQINDDGPLVTFKEDETGKQVVVSKECIDRLTKDSDLTLKHQQASEAAQANELPVKMQPHNSNKNLPAGVSIVGEMAASKNEAAAQPRK